MTAAIDFYRCRAKVNLHPYQIKIFSPAHTMNCSLGYLLPHSLHVETNTQRQPTNKELRGML